MQIQSCLFQCVLTNVLACFVRKPKVASGNCTFHPNWPMVIAVPVPRFQVELHSFLPWSFWKSRATTLKSSKTIVLTYMQQLQNYVQPTRRDKKLYTRASLLPFVHVHVVQCKCSLFTCYPQQRSSPGSRPRPAGADSTGFPAFAARAKWPRVPVVGARRRPAPGPRHHRLPPGCFPGSCRATA